MIVEFIPGFLVRLFARPYVAGDRLQDGLDVAYRLWSGAGILTTLDLLAEEVTSEQRVRENLETGYAPLKHKDRSVPDVVYELFPVLKSMLGRRGGDLSGGQQQQLAIGRALVTRPKLLVLDEPTEGIQPSIIKDIGRAIVYLKEKAGLAIVLVEQYLDFARELADRVAIMDRGEVVFSGTATDLDDPAVQRHLTV